MILHVFSSEAAIRASSCSYGTIRGRFAGARFRFARVRAASLEIFSSLRVRDPHATSPISLSTHLYCWAILTLRDDAVSESLIVQRISRQPSLVSILGLTSKLTRDWMSVSRSFSRYFSFPADRDSLLRHSIA